MFNEANITQLTLHVRVCRWVNIGCTCFIVGVTIKFQSSSISYDIAARNRHARCNAFGCSAS